ncbi:TMEM56 [Branchiostoma lanceolatum]|uniref:TMEM56 protein n=1 Tax=Branchiostoma lanceolatum TaxID=7740 RepID=A0A8K0EXJ8_BRALA|nr:TMEM56 [Branchiostoma lanceolatum]
MAYSVQHVLTILGSVFFHLAVFKWFAAPVLRRLWPVFATLPADKQVSSQNYVMSLMHGAVAGGLACYAFLYSYVTTGQTVVSFNVKLWDVSTPVLQYWCTVTTGQTMYWCTVTTGQTMVSFDVKLRYDCPFVRHTACIVLGHTAVDLLLMLWYSPLRSREMAVHHVCALWAAYLGSVGPNALYYGNLGTMTELSSPFLNLRHILHNMGQKKSLLYKVNGVVLLVVFFLCRILTIPLWLSLRKHLGTDELYGAGLAVKLGLFVLFPLLNLLNVFWFSKICRAVYRGLFQPKAN